MGCRLCLSYRLRRVTRRRSRRRWRCPTGRSRRKPPTCLSSLCSCDWKQNKVKLSLKWSITCFSLGREREDEKVGSPCISTTTMLAITKMSQVIKTLTYSESHFSSLVWLGWQVETSSALLFSSEATTWKWNRLYEHLYLILICFSVKFYCFLVQRTVLSNLT